MRGIAAIELSNASSTGWAWLHELDRDERNHLIAEQPLVDDGADRPDHAAAEQRFQPPQAIGRGHADAQRQLVVANPPVLLQLGEYLQIDAVELVTPGHPHLVMVPS